MNEQFWAFVEKNINEDANKLRLKYHNRKDVGFDIDLAITQIECRKRFGKKLHETLAEHPRWLFPSVLSGEQSTSDKLAQYHATLIDECSEVTDLTAGLGIDALHISKWVAKLTAVEIDPVKAEALMYNFAGSKVNIVNDDCIQYVQSDRIADHRANHCLFIDPARRADDGSRVFAISQCKPDVTAMMPQLRAIASKMIVKMSPMLDITQTLRDMPNTTRIIALGTETECKELIAVVDLSTECAPNTEISAVTLKNDGTEAIVNFTPDEERNETQGQVTLFHSQMKQSETQGQVTLFHSQMKQSDLSPCSIPMEGDYLYDPYPSVMKAGPFKLLAVRYEVKKISNNTHLYISDKYIPDFPGLVYRIEKVIPYNSKYIKRLKKDYPRASVKTRNFDVPADKLRSKLGITDSNDLRLYAVILSNGDKTMLIAR